MTHAWEVYQPWTGAVSPKDSSQWIKTIKCASALIGHTMDFHK
jgi:hypothetical protein